MKVIKKKNKTMLEKINEEIEIAESNNEEIIRIELTLKEFKDFIRDVPIYTNINPSSGSYVVYQGICIQTHEDY